MLQFPPPASLQDVPIPQGPWKQLSDQEKADYINLRNYFHQMKKTIKEQCSSSFPQEIASIIKYIDSSPISRENRCVCVGFAISGPFIAVNTRLLMSFLGRCKSSINGSLQSLGYLSLRSKTKARECVLNILPSFKNDPNLIRQWTVRCATSSARTCFCSVFPPEKIPTISSSDLNDSGKGRVKQQTETIPGFVGMPSHTVQFQDYQPQYSLQQQESEYPTLEMAQSYSVECFPHAQENELTVEPFDSYQITHSTSTYFPESYEWNWDK